MSGSLASRSGLLGDGAPRCPPAENAPAEECAFERPVAVHAAAAEAAHLTRRIEPRDGCAIRVERLPGQVGLDAAEALAREDVQLHRDERAGLRVENAVRLRHPDQFVAAVVAGLAYGVDLRVFRE